jgi:hypothetical protein
MPFFEVEYPDDEVAEEEEPDGFDDLRPASWIGGVVPRELVVARSQQAAVVVRGLVAYPEGFEFTLQAFVHHSVRLKRRYHDLFWHHHRRSGGGPVPDELLRFGVAWPDGGRATNLDHWGRDWPDATEPVHGIEEHGGGGTNREYTQDYWAWPLPGPGELRFVCEWPAFGIVETFAAVDGTLLIEASQRATPVWPDDAGRSSHTSRTAMIQAMRLRSSDDPDGGPGVHDV